MNHLPISVVLCTYNGEAFLGEQLNSLLDQVRRPDEIVAVDDASTDATWEMLEVFASRARDEGIGVQLIRQPRNVGFVENFSHALRQATGEVLFLCDQDDRWHHDKIASMAVCFEREADLLLLFSDARLVDAQGHALPYSLFEALELDLGERAAVHAGQAFEVLLRRGMVTGATASLRRCLLDLALPIGEGWIHDEWLAVVAAAVGRISVIERALVDYRQHASNQIGMRKRSWWDKWRDLVGPRRQQFLAEVCRMASLHGHLAQLDADRFALPLERITRKREHFERRVELGNRPRWTRLPGVLREAACGHYVSYGTGGRSILRDLLRRD